LLYAGTTSFSFKYSTLIDIVKKLKQRSISAGNISFISNGTSETLRNETVKIENIKFVSIHVPTHLKPLNNYQFGHYLAGLIDGNGHFSSKQQLAIVFHSLDVSLAYYIKKRLGFGSVRKVKEKNAFILIIAAIKGIEKILNLINGKIRTENKYNQINNNILNHSNFTEFGKSLSFMLNIDKDLKNHWLAGFSDADASFQIKVLNRSKIAEIILNFKIDQKKNYLLLLIKEFLGGNVGYINSQDTYYYGSTSFGSAKNVINYFDSFHLLSTKHINYLKWRKAYLIIQDKNHLNTDGLEKVIKLKKTMNRLSDITV
jgi:LAGLIDADG endonuclease